MHIVDEIGDVTVLYLFHSISFYFYCISITIIYYSLNGSYPHSLTILLHKFLVTDSPERSRLLLCGLRSKGVITTPADHFCWTHTVPGTGTECAKPQGLFKHLEYL